MSTNLAKIILKSKNYPDKICWEAEDPGTYRIACDQNIVDRPECARHMDPLILDKVRLEHALSDIFFHRNHSHWRQKSAVMYWASYKNQWLDHPEVIAKLGRETHRWSFNNIRFVTRKCSSIQEWQERSKKSYDIALVKGWVFHPALIDHMNSKT